MSPADYLMVSPRMSQTLAEYVTPEKAKLSARVTPGGYCPADDRVRLVRDINFTDIGYDLTASLDKRASSSHRLFARSEDCPRGPQRCMMIVIPSSRWL
jgi:hypothetical protein